MSDFTKAICGDWLNGKTVIVTGASGGMGAGIAATLIKKHNCRVVGVARNEAKMLKFIEELGPMYKDQFSYKLLMFLQERLGRVLRLNLPRRALFRRFSLITQVFFLSLRDLTDILMKKLKRQ